MTGKRATKYSAGTYDHCGGAQGVERMVKCARSGEIEAYSSAQWSEALDECAEQLQKAGETFEKALARAAMTTKGATLLHGLQCARRYERTGKLPPVRGSVEKRDATELRKKHDTAKGRVDAYIGKLREHDPSMTYEQAFAKAWSRSSPVLSDITAMRELESQIWRAERGAA